MAYTTFLRGTIIAFLTFLAPVFAMAATLSVSPASGSVTVGGILTVQIQVNTESGMSDGIDIRYLNFNPSLLQVIDENTSVAGVQITPGALMPNTATNSADNTAGRVLFSQVPAGGTTFTNTASQTLATVRFSVLAAGTATLTFNHTPGSTTDSNVASGGSDLLTSVTNGSYTLGAANSPPTVSAISTNVADVDPGTPGIQYYEGSTVTYSGSASDPNGDAITWTWLYTINSGPEIQFSTGTGAVQNAVFTYGAGTAGSTYRWILRVTDGKSSPVQSTLDVQIITAPDTTPPVLSNIASSNITTSGALITWNTNELADSQVEYGITTSYGSLSPVNATLKTSHSITLSSLSPSTTYNYRVRSRDAAGNLALSLNRAFTTQSLPDTTPPNAVINLSAGSITTTSATLSWSAPADLPGGGTVASYDIRYSTAPITELNFGSATVVTGEPTPAVPGTTQTYVLAGLNFSTQYYVALRSQDSQGNASLISNVVNFTTQTPPDTTPPSVPANLVATAASVSRVDLTWSASTDNVGVLQYHVERCQGASCATFIEIATPTATNYANTGLAANTTYRYRVRAEDMAGNLSGYSSIASATTVDTIAPSISITAPVANDTVAGTITISATAADNVGVLGVQFILDGGNFGTEDTSAPYAISWNTTGVADGSHILTAQARDAAGNTTLSAGITVNVLNNPPPPFDFSLSNTGDKGVTQGGSITNTVTATLVSGTTKTVSFSVSGLPAGAIGSFVPASCDPGCSTILTITAGAATPVGPNTITVTGIDGSVTRTTSFRLDITPPPSNKFKTSDRIAVRSASGNGAGVRDSASLSGTLLATQPDGALGTVIGGPVYADNLHWWQIDYDTSGGIGSDTDGWSSENNLEIAVFATNVKLTPFVEGNGLAGRDFTVKIVQRATGATLFTISTQPDVQNELPLSIEAPNLLEGTYNFFIKSPGYLQSRMDDVVVSSGAMITLLQLRGGDFNDDGIINNFDWSYMNSNNRWFSSDILADLNRDGIVNSIDYSYLNRNWGVAGD
jgi:chitodextrinase